MPKPLKVPKTNGQPEEVSGLGLKLSYWYVIHKPQLKPGIIIFLAVLGLIFYGYAGYRLAVILINERDFKNSVSNLPQELINYPYFREANKPKALEIVSFDIAGGEDQRYDYIAKVRNPNPNYVASAVIFQLVSGDTVLAEKSSFIYPNEEKYLAFFGQTANAAGGAAVRIDQVSWRRFAKFADFADSRLRFSQSEVVFKSAMESGIRGELPVSTLNFKITNGSAYSYWRVGVYMVLYNGSSLVGANYILLDQFESGRMRPVEMKWYEPMSSVSRVEIAPEVDILDAAAYMPVE